MKKPVICTLDEKTYEEAAIRKWLIEHRSALYNRMVMSPDQSIDKVLIRNRNLKDAIEEFCQKNQKYVTKVSPTI